MAKDQAKKKVVYKKAPSIKGNSKIASEKDTENNPLLRIDPASEFIIEVGNFLEDPYILINPGYESFNPQDNSSLDGDRLDEASEMMVILRYFEYVIIARFPVRFILPLWMDGNKTGDMSLADIIQSIEHRLQMELQLRTPSFDQINTLDIHYLYKIMYVTQSMIKSCKSASEANQAS